MNHFAHLVLSRFTVESAVGNLLGDFARGLQVDELSAPVLAGLYNHRAVDRFTDNHPLVIEMRRGFGPQRRRFAGIALDIYFDHLLLDYWAEFEGGEPDPVIEQCYELLAQGQGIMPGEEMRRVTARMVDYDWFGSYRDIDSVAQALDRVAGRIRFANKFDHSIDDLLANDTTIRAGFREFYPQLKAHIAELALEDQGT